MNVNAKQGYSGKVLKELDKARVNVGDRVKIMKGEDSYEGFLIPRIKGSEHIVIKLDSGYNIGISFTSKTKIIRVGEGVKPSFQPPPHPRQKPGLPRISILSTGGTIASRVDYRTGAVRPALTADDLYSVVPELSDLAKVEAKVLFSLLSENITTEHWKVLAEAVAKAIRSGKTGVVIAHGTDTMGYTSAALAFALQNLPVPVVLVGSQRSADRPSSDAASNLIGAVEAAAYAPFAEVVIAMHESVSDSSIVFHRGTKVRKLHTSRRDAFKSVNTQPIAWLNDEGQMVMLSDRFSRRNSKVELTVKNNFNSQVALLKFYPNLNPKKIEWLTSQGYLGIVLEGTGLGHVGKYCIQAVADAVESGILVAMTSQCLYGRVNMNVYDQGRDLQAAGVVPLGDMLSETALVKLMWIFGQTTNLKEAEKLLKKDFAHEFTPRSVYSDPSSEGENGSD